MVIGESFTSMGLALAAGGVVLLPPVVSGQQAARTARPTGVGDIQPTAITANSGTIEWTSCRAPSWSSSAASR
jgi:hypothetical protein